MALIKFDDVMFERVKVNDSKGGIVGKTLGEVSAQDLTVAIMEGEKVERRAKEVLKSGKDKSNQSSSREDRYGAIALTASAPHTMIPALHIEEED